MGSPPARDSVSFSHNIWTKFFGKLIVIEYKPDCQKSMDLFALFWNLPLKKKQRSRVYSVLLPKSAHPFDGRWLEVECKMKQLHLCAY